MTIGMDKFIKYCSNGIFSDMDIAELITDGHIQSNLEIDNSLVQPASLDLRLGTTAFRVKASFLPGPNSTVNKQIKHNQLHCLDLTKGAVLEVGCTYIVELAESLELPSALAAATNPKSSTGRLDIFTRTLCDFATSFDKIPFGYHGPVYLEITPRTFPIKVRTGSRLTQMRFASYRIVLGNEAHKQLHNRLKITSSKNTSFDAGVSVSIDLASYPIVGFKAQKHTNVIDLDEISILEVLDYWEPIKRTKDQSIILDPGEFYILSSAEEILIPHSHAAEMVPFDPSVGEMRAHYAGFFDPGFGAIDINDPQSQGSRAVLEVRCHEVPFIMNHGQIIAKLKYEEMRTPPTINYGSDLNSNYQGQRLRLSKHFKPFNQ